MGDEKNSHEVFHYLTTNWITKYCKILFGRKQKMFAAYSLNRKHEYSSSASSTRIPFLLGALSCSDILRST